MHLYRPSLHRATLLSTACHRQHWTLHSPYAHRPYHFISMISVVQPQPQTATKSMRFPCNHIDVQVRNARPIMARSIANPQQKLYERQLEQTARSRAKLASKIAVGESPRVRHLQDRLCMHRGTTATCRPHTSPTYLRIDWVCNALLCLRRLTSTTP